MSSRDRFAFLARFAACVLSLVSGAALAADDKVPAGVRQALAKALAPNQVLGPGGRLPGGHVTGDFGYSIAVSDKYVVIGAPSDSIQGNSLDPKQPQFPNVGGVYVFQRVNSTTAPWKFLERIVPGTTAPERFGQSVAVSGDLILVGAPGLKGLTGTGRALLYGRDARDTTPPLFTALDSTITAGQAGITNPGAAFGESVGIIVQKIYNFTTGTTTTSTQLFIGAPQADTADPSNGTIRRTGAVIVFDCLVTKQAFPNPPGYNCNDVQTLLPPRHATGVDFGQSLAAALPPKVSLFGSPITLVVGSPDQCSVTLCFSFNGSPIPMAGVAYVFMGSKASWGTPTTLFPGSGSQTGDDFGAAVAFNGTHVAVGAPLDASSTGVRSNGSVRIYEKTSTSSCGLSGQPACTWAFRQALAPKDTADPMLFGRRVSFYGNQLLVGAPNRTVAGNTLQGSAFYFEVSRDAFFLREEIFRTGVTGNTNFGSAVAVLGGNLMVGEQNGPNGASNSTGLVYSYSLSPTIARNPNPAPPAEAPQDRYGTTTVVRDGVLVIGSPGAASGALANVGAVRIMVASSVTPGQYDLVQTITPPAEELVANLRFGHALGLTANGNRIIVGAPGADAVPGDGSVVPVGAAFVYERVAGQTQWLPAVQNGKLLHASPQLNSDFGAAIDVDPAGALLVVGAPLADRVLDGSSNTVADVGAVTIFRDIANATGSDAKGKSTYDVGEDVPPPDGAGVGDKWGSSVATDGDSAAAGAPEDGTGEGEDGYVTVVDDAGGGSFDNTDVIEAPEDAPETTTDEQDFGSSIDMEDGTLAVGAPGTDVPDEDSAAANADEGAVYAYPVSGGLADEGTMMEAPSGEPGDKWGTAVATDDGEVAAGGPGVDVPPADSVSPPADCTVDMCEDQGAVSTYTCDYNEQGLIVCGYSDTLYGDGAGADEGVGSSVGIHGDTIIAGAPRAGSQDEGAVYAAEDLFLTDGVFRDGFE